MAPSSLALSSTPTAALIVCAVAACILVTAIVTLRMRHVPTSTPSTARIATDVEDEATATALSTERIPTNVETETEAPALEAVVEAPSPADVASDVSTADDDAGDDEPASEPSDSSAATTEASGSSEDDQDDAEDEHEEAHDHAVTTMCESPASNASMVPSSPEATDLPLAFTSSLVASIAKSEPSSSDKKPRRRRRSSRSRKATLDGPVKSTASGKPTQTRRRHRAPTKASTTRSAVAVAAM